MERKDNNLAQFSFFRYPISNTRPVKNITLVDAYNYIISDTAKQRTQQLRSLGDAKQRRKFKADNFDYCTFSGTFEYRKDKALIQHSNLLCVDFDHLANLGEFCSKLLRDEYFDTQLLFLSPSGDGLKWIININISKAPHRDYFRAITNYISYTYGVTIDQSGKDISRACFLPCDPNCFINQNRINHGK